ncbi:hypothetical protein A0H81_13856 [Grifola frondosa]|uniref:Uncharacterized protein n=1 Tax=Grifola frondosa TaxID=5627 RepID=A0A1C7LNL4_GRIFR|nr:hypothetical protein A0H81_13856 [Grifola frondosa]
MTCIAFVIHKVGAGSINIICQRRHRLFQGEMDNNYAIFQQYAAVPTEFTASGLKRTAPSFSRRVRVDVGDTPASPLLFSVVQSPLGDIVCLVPHTSFTLFDKVVLVIKVSGLYTEIVKFTGRPVKVVYDTVSQRVSLFEEGVIKVPYFLNFF